MAEDVNRTILDNDLTRQLRKIAGDLWGAPGREDDAVTAEPKPKKKAPVRVVVEQPAIGIDNLWMTADESIDWTDALGHSRPSDGLTDPRLWQFYHEKAANVLAGDVKAYADVLAKSNPLGELTAFAERIAIRPENADRLTVQCKCKAKELEARPEKYPAAMSIRIARDLFSCLPVSEVAVNMALGNEPVMTVTYRRDQLLHRNFTFLDPVAFAAECGAVYAKDAKETDEDKGREST